MKDIKRFGVVSLLVMAVTAFAQNPDSIKVWVSRSVTPQTIYYEGAWGGDTATVAIKAWHSQDSLCCRVGSKDVILLTDNSASMVAPGAFVPRLPIGYNVTPPITRIQGTYNACADFINNFMKNTDRVAHLRFCHHMDTSFNYTSDYNYAKAKLDTMLTGFGDGTGLYASVNRALRYMSANRRDSVEPILIVMTDGIDNSSGSYHGNWYDSTLLSPTCSTLYHRGIVDSMGASINAAADSLLRSIDALKATGFKFRIYAICLGMDTISFAWDNQMLRAIASHGNGEYAYSATGADLNAVFQVIGQKTDNYVAAIQVAPSSPMIVDVLGNDIHYVPSSLRLHTDSSHFAKNATFSTDSVTTSTGQHMRLIIKIDTLKTGQILYFDYKITAALREFGYTNFGKPMPVNRSFSDDTAAYSRIKYKTTTNVIIEKKLDKGIVSVKNKTDLYLSSYRSSLPANGTITLNYGHSTPAVFGPDTLWPLLGEHGTGVGSYSTVACSWRFAPNPGWTVTPDANVDYSAPPVPMRQIGISVMGDSSLQSRDTLWIKTVDNLYTAYLVFNALYDNSMGTSAPASAKRIYRELSASPNPFNFSTSISYSMPDQQKGLLSLYSSDGSLILKQDVRGSGVFRWDAGKRASGVYLCKLTVGKAVFVRKMMLMR